MGKGCLEITTQLGVLILVSLMSRAEAQTSSGALCDADRLILEVREPTTPAARRTLSTIHSTPRQSTHGPKLRYELNRGRFRSIEFRGSNQAARMRSLGGSASQTVPCETRQQACAQITELVSEVLRCEPVHAYAIQTDANDTHSRLQWGLSDLPGEFGIKAPSAWQYSRGKDTVIAIIDTGVDYKHFELAPNIWTNPRERKNGADDDRNGVADDVHGWDFADRDPDPMDYYGHGTHVAGLTVAAGNKRSGIVGAAFESKVLALKVLADGETFFREDDVAAAINYATDFAQSSGKRTIMNLSLGGFGESRVLREAIHAATAAGVVVVAAAGNTNRNTDITQFTPTTFPEVIGVASIGRTGLRSQFSNHGAHTVDIAAPGEDIVSTVPGGLTARASGTSQAAPFVSATAALTLSRCSSSTNVISPSYLSYLLKRSATPLSADFTQSGLVNALEALQWCSALVAPFDMQGRYHYLLLSNPGAASSYKVWLEAGDGTVLPISAGDIGVRAKKKVSLDLGTNVVIAEGRARLFVAASNPSLTALLKVAAPLSRAKGGFHPHVLRLSPARTQPSSLTFKVPQLGAKGYRATLSIVSRGPLPQEYMYEIFKGSKSLGQRAIATGPLVDASPVLPQATLPSTTMGDVPEPSEVGAPQPIAAPFSTFDLPLDGPGSYLVTLTVRSSDPEPFSASVLVGRTY